MYRIELEALGQKVHNALRTLIISGELKPGQKLLQKRLAEFLGVSRTPLIMAFSKLEQENLITSIPRRGFYVSQYTNKELLDICNIRIRLEPLSVREAALHATPESLARIEKAHKAFEKATKSNDENLLKQADYDFHMELLKAGKNNFLYDILCSYSVIVINMSGLMRYAELSMVQHHNILDAVKAGDADKAEALMIEHAQRPLQFIKSE
jgi:DNA-binding GntR family transcriptional regulator